MSLDYFVNEYIPRVFMLNTAIGLNHFYGLMVVNQVVRSIRGGCAFRYIRLETGTPIACKKVVNEIYNDLSDYLNSDTEFC